MILLIALALLCSSLRAEPLTYPATVVRVIDGDTIKLDMVSWSSTPFQVMDVRIFGIDSPESRMPPAKCVTEVKRGKVATNFARTLAAPGDPVWLTYMGHDKYFRIDGAVRLKDDSDFAEAMIKAGMAAPYTGHGPKTNWCHR